MLPIVSEIVAHFLIQRNLHKHRHYYTTMVLLLLALVPAVAQVAQVAGHQ